MSCQGSMSTPTGYLCSNTATSSWLGPDTLTRDGQGMKKGCDMEEMTAVYTEKLGSGGPCVQ